MSHADAEGLAVRVAEDRALGCSDRSASLGIRTMPPGYALMLDADEAYFYWLRHDGASSDIHWNKWAVYRGAWANARASRSASSGTEIGGVE